MTAIPVTRISRPEDFERALALRYVVFCDEQGVPREIERDEADEGAAHVLVESPAGEVLGTGRVVRMRTDHSLHPLRAAAAPGDVARIGRMAVRRDARGRGLGEAMLAELERAAKEAGLTEAVLHAQLHAEGFYARLGYGRTGPEFDEAGIPHVEMSKRL